MLLYDDENDMGWASSEGMKMAMGITQHIKEVLRN